MNKLRGQPQEMNRRLEQMMPYAVIAVLLIVGYFILFHTGNNTAQAQVNPGRVGEAVVEQITGAATERSAEIAEVEAELEDPGSTGMDFEEEEIDITPSEDMAGDSVELIEEPEEEMVSVMDFSLSSEGLGGKYINDLDQEELSQYLFQLEDTQGDPRCVNQLIPILQRFQVMTSPPRSWMHLEEDETPPWLSESRRYSPFDPVGGGGGAAPSMLGHPIPPFPPIERGVDYVETGLTAQQVARSIKLVGVMGEAGDYMAILSAYGEDVVLNVGDEVITRENQTFIVEEISQTGVRIMNQARPQDKGLIQFVEQELSGIEISISN